MNTPRSIVCISILIILLVPISARAEGFPVILDGNDSSVGYWQMTVGGGQQFNILTHKGVFLDADFRTGEIIANRANFYGCELDNEPLYTQDNCVGPMKLKTQNSIGSRCGLILEKLNIPSGQLALSASAAVATETIIRARHLSNGSCSNYPSPQIFVTVDVQPNDPSLSGVAGTSFVAPLRVVLEGSGNCMFRNGYEFCD